MKQSKASFEEYAGIVIGGLIYFFVYVLNINDLLIAFPVLFTYQAGYSQIGYWMKIWTFVRFRLCIYILCSTKSN